MWRQNIFNSRPVMIINTFRKLWEQHIMWTRSFIISTASDLKDLDLVTKRLLQNPSDFADVLKMFYGSRNAETFKTLFEQHLLIAADLVNNAKAGNAEGADNARKKWYRNADDIAEFLSSINPYWSKEEWQNNMYAHLEMTETEAAERLNGQYAKDIITYGMIENQALEMADLMSSGILEQFRIL